MVEWLDTTRFRLIKPLSKGGMGQVLLVEQRSLGRLVVIKTVIKEKALYYERLKREARAASSLLNHQHVVSVIDYCSNEDGRNGPPYIVMEFVEGQSLDKQTIKDFSQAQDIGYQIAEALFYIHDHHIVHRDIKPHNVFLTTERTPSTVPGQRDERLIAKVGDFGIALLPEQPHITEEGGFLGTFVWAAPEQVTSPESVDTRADLYSFGLTLYWLLTGKLPPTFDRALALFRSAGRDQEQVMKARLELIKAKREVPPAPSSVNILWPIPPQLDDLVLKLLRPEPVERYQTVDEALISLDEIRNSLEQSPTSTTRSLTEDRAPETTEVSPLLSVSSSTGQDSRIVPQGLHIAGLDLMRARTPDRVRQIFGYLGYPVDEGEISLIRNTYDEFEWTPKNVQNIQKGYWLAGHDDLQLLLFELRDVSVAALSELAANLWDRGGFYFFVAAKPTNAPHSSGEAASGKEQIYEQLIMVCPQVKSRNQKPGASMIKLSRLIIDTARPTRHQLNVLEAMAISESDRALSGEAIYRKILAAFNVETLTEDFYKDYDALYHYLEKEVPVYNAHITELVTRSQEVQSFVQRLLDRLMFLYFIQKKGWLADTHNFLTAQLRLCQLRGVDFYRELLVPLFFDVLSRPQDERNGQHAGGRPWSEEEIPYLGGGLFELDNDYAYEPSVKLPNELFDPKARMGILKVLSSYDFTVQEDTPLDVEVSVDPEMLGKVFEELVTGRHETGSYYTPRAVVSFMCRETIKGYLTRQLPRETEEGIRLYVDEHKIDGLHAHRY